MKTMLVTGGTGFLGSNFVRHVLHEHPHRIVNLDLLTFAANTENLADLEHDSRYTFVQGDICDRELVQAVFDHFQPDIVVNFAAESYVDRSIVNPELFVRTNVTGTQVLLETAARSWRLDSRNPRTYRDGAKFLQVSAAEVYGDLGDRDEAFTEASPLAPRTPYAATKAGADLLVRAYHESYALPVNIVRGSITYGPYQFPEKLVPMVIDASQAALPIEVYGDGGQVRDWLHVHDHCSALDLVAHRGRPGATYLAGGEHLTNREAIEAVLAELGHPGIEVRQVAERAMNDRRVVLDSSLLRAELGWKPEWTFRAGVAQTIEWYRRRPDWIRRVKAGLYRRTSPAITWSPSA